MPRTKKVKPVEEAVEAVETVEQVEANPAFLALIEKYKLQNPVKYELKKAELLAKLNK